MRRRIVGLLVVVIAFGWTPAAVGRPPGYQCFSPTIRGTNQADILIGTEGNDVIRAKRGADLILGLGGNDVLCGNLGADRIIGGDGHDKGFGGHGADYCDTEQAEACEAP